MIKSGQSFSLTCANQNELVSQKPVIQYQCSQVINNVCDLSFQLVPTWRGRSLPLSVVPNKTISLCARYVTGHKVGSVRVSRCSDSEVRTYIVPGDHFT